MHSPVILLYSPVLTGHPQVYCRVIGDIILDHGCRFCLATGDTDDWESKWPDLKPFAGKDEFRIVSTLHYSGNGNIHLTAEELHKLQTDLQADATLFIEPEHFRDQFVRIGNGQARSLRGRNIGIFGGTTEWYPGEEFYSGRKIGRFEGTLRQNLGRIKRSIFNPHTIDKYFYENILIERQVLDAVIVKDERVAEKFGPPVWWLPEIYKVFDSCDDDEGEDEWQRLSPLFNQFASQCSPDDLVLFFGAGAWYKGYDYFIQLLAREPSSFGIHAGSGIRYVKGKDFIGVPDRERRKLREQGRLFETGGYVKSQRFIDHVFSSSRRFVSTHRLTVSSGTMLQALDMGLPVLVPDSGLVGHRARAFGVGHTYRYGDIDDLVEKWGEFKHVPVELFQDKIKNFMRRFDRSAVEKLFVKVLLDVDVH